MRFFFFSPSIGYRSFEQGQERVLLLLLCQVPDTEEGTQSAFVELDYPSDSACLPVKPPETGRVLFPFKFPGMLKKYRETLISSESERGCKKRGK